MKCYNLKISYMYKMFAYTRRSRKYVQNMKLSKENSKVCVRDPVCRAIRERTIGSGRVKKHIDQIYVFSCHYYKI